MKTKTSSQMMDKTMHFIFMAALTVAAMLPVAVDADAAAGRIVRIDMDCWNVVDGRDSIAILDMWDAMHVASTLQGIVNREAPLLYIRYVRQGEVNVDDYWLDKYTADGRWLAGREIITISDPVEAASMFRDKVRGLVVYDSDVFSTSNAASTVAGVEDLIAVRYDTRPESAYSRLVEQGFRPRVWLVRKNGASRFKDKLGPYRWAYRRYLRKGRCSGDFAAYYIDQYWRRAKDAAVMNHHQLTNHDYFVSRKAFFFDLSPWDDEPATDAPQGKAGSDLEMLKDILDGICRFGTREPSSSGFCHIGGFPAWAFKYTDYGNAGGRHGPVETEWQFARLISEYNAYKDADAISLGAMANASFWQHFPLKDSYPQKWTNREELISKGYLTPDGKVDMTRKYVIMYVGDYDASSWIYQLAPDIWDDPSRGRIPLMWCISPVLAHRAPMAMDYSRETASENDYFAAADNGAGYLNPGQLEAPREISGYPDAVDAWCTHNMAHYRKWGLTVSGFIIDGAGKGMTQRGFQSYAKFSPGGIVAQKCPPVDMVDGMPVLRAGPDVNDASPAQAARSILSGLEEHPDFPFYWFRAIIRKPSWYAEVKEKLEAGDSDVVWMSAPDFFELLRCHQTSVTPE